MYTYDRNLKNPDTLRVQGNPSMAHEYYELDSKEYSGWLLVTVFLVFLYCFLIVYNEPVLVVIALCSLVGSGLAAFRAQHLVQTKGTIIIEYTYL